MMLLVTCTKIISGLKGERGRLLLLSVRKHYCDPLETQINV